VDETCEDVAIGERPVETDCERVGKVVGEPVEEPVTDPLLVEVALELREAVVEIVGVAAEVLVDVTEYVKAELGVVVPLSAALGELVDDALLACERVRLAL